MAKQDVVGRLFEQKGGNQSAFGVKEGQTLSIEDDNFYLEDPVDETKRVRIDAGSISTGSDRVLNVPDRDLTLGGGDGTRGSIYVPGGVYGTPIVLTTAMSGRLVVCDQAAGTDITLPAIAAADVGVVFEFLLTATITSNNLRITAAAGDLLTGGILMFDFDAAYTAPQGAGYFPNGSSHLVCTMNGTTTGGKKGTRLRYVATSATSWWVDGVAYGDGVLATPFS